MKVTNPDQLLVAYEKGERDFRNSDLKGVDLSWSYLKGVNLDDADLEGADITRVDLKDASLNNTDLRGANLQRIDLEGADLRKADLKNADLKDAYLKVTDLFGADLRYANLNRANLEGASLIEADLRGADLRRSKLKDTTLREADLTETKIDYQIEPDLLEKVVKFSLKKGALDMGFWHTCDTCHCIAGWAVYLAENGRELERELGTANAGLILLGKEAYSHFYDSNDDARKYLKSILEK